MTPTDQAGGAYPHTEAPDPEHVIATLLRQLAERDAERDAALAREAALADVLAAINASPGDLAPVFDTMLDRAIHLSGAACAGLFTYDGKAFQTAALRDVPPAFAEFLAKAPRLPAIAAAKP